jgi:L-ascorbate metabolism protein UlaG (beta-lactamase superfamily)
MQHDATEQDCHPHEGIVMTNPHTASSFTASGPGIAPSGSIFFVGSATMVIRFDGFTILTDPAFNRRGEQTWLGHGLMATRLIDPAITAADLPFVDMILLSGYCGDHFDARAEQELDKGILIVSTPDSAADVAERGFHRTRALSCWQSMTLEEGHSRLTVTSVPAGPGPRDVMGSVLEFRAHPAAAPYRIYISGDTMMTGELHHVHARLDPIDLAILHMGGTRIGGMTVTMDASEAMKVMQAINARITIPIHYDDYDVFTSPLADFQALVDQANLGERVRYLRQGEAYGFESHPLLDSSRHF